MADSIIKDFWLCFVPIFVAVDAVGTLPIFVGMIGTAEKKRTNRVVKTAIITALAVALPFIFLGEAVLRIVNVTPADFMVAGGIILMLLSVRDLLAQDKLAWDSNIESLGPVPLGVPLIVGPAVLTTILLLTRQHGFLLTTICTMLNILLAGVVFRFSDVIVRIIGMTGSKIASKIANLFLAAIAVMMIRKGIVIIMSKNFLLF